jgi:hypothetical protein
LERRDAKSSGVVAAELLIVAGCTLSFVREDRGDGIK